MPTLQSINRKKYRGDSSTQVGTAATPTPFREDHVPSATQLRHIRRLQRHLEAGFWDEDPNNEWVGAEVLLGSDEYRKLLSWYLRRKPFFQPGVLDDYCRLLARHMKGKTITAHISIDPEDGWMCLWFTIYGLPRLRRWLAIHDEHRAFLDDLFDEGPSFRHTSEHIGISIADTPYRQRR